MEYEIYKATNSIHGYCKVGKLKPEKSIPDLILRQAKGLAIITVVMVRMMVTYKICTGLVVADELMVPGLLLLPSLLVVLYMELRLEVR